MIGAYFGSIEAMILTTGILVGVSAALLGSFLVLRGSAMLTDAISHAIVLGIVLVWLATGRTTGPVQLVGAAMAGLATVVLSEALVRTRLVRMDAAIGLVFPALFAAGVLLVALFARDMHLDVDTVLLGEIGFVWLDTVAVGGQRVPVAVLSLSAVLAVNLAFVLLLWKELKIACFDPALAAALGLAPGLVFHALLALTSVTAVAAFDAVGAILFIAFAIVPPATAFLLTERLGRMVVLAIGLSALACVAGYWLAILWDVSIAGMMATSTGGLFALALAFSPQQGLIARGFRRRTRRLDMECLALVVHLQAHAGSPEAQAETAVAALTAHLRWTPERARAVILRSLDRGLIIRDGDRLSPTEKGAAMARPMLAAPAGT